MPGPVSHDSISRCNQTDSVYDVIQNPNARPLKKAPPPPLDTLHRAQARVNLETSERFKIHGLQLSHESFVVAAQVGKYIFLTIMVPVYLCTYGIPKWIVTQLIPKVFVKCEWLHIGKFAKPLSEKITDLMSGLIKQLIGNGLQFFHLTYQRFTHVARTCTNIGRNFSKKAYASLSKFIKPVLKHTSEKIKEETQKLIGAISERFHAVAETTNNFVIIPVINFISFPFQIIKTQISRSRHIQSHLQSSYHKAKNFVLSLAKNTCKLGQHWITYLCGIISRLYKWLSGLVKWIEGHICRIMERIMPPVKNCMSLARNATHQGIGRLAARFKVLKNHVEKQVLFPLFSLLSALLHSIKNYLDRQKKSKLVQFFMKSCQFIMKQGTRLKSAALPLHKIKKVQRIKSGLKNSGEFLKIQGFLFFKRNIPLLRKQLTLLPQRIWNGTVLLSKSLAKICVKVLYKMRVLGAWGILFLRECMVHTHISANQFISWMNQDHEIE